MSEDPERLVEDVARRVVELRERAGRTQAEIAEALETTVSNYQRIEHGLQNLTLRTMAKLANAIGVRVAEFFVEPQASEPRKRGRPRTKK